MISRNETPVQYKLDSPNKVESRKQATHLLVRQQHFFFFFFLQCIRTDPAGIVHQVYSKQADGHSPGATSKWPGNITSYNYRTLRKYLANHNRSASSHSDSTITNYLLTIQWIFIADCLETVKRYRRGKKKKGMVAKQKKRWHSINLPPVSGKGNKTNAPFPVTSHHKKLKKKVTLGRILCSIIWTAESAWHPNKKIFFVKRWTSCSRPRQLAAFKQSSDNLSANSVQSTLPHDAAPIAKTKKRNHKSLQACVWSWPPMQILRHICQKKKKKKKKPAQTN